MTMDCLLFITSELIAVWAFYVSAGERTHVLITASITYCIKECVAFAALYINL